MTVNIQDNRGNETQFTLSISTVVAASVTIIIAIISGIIIWVNAVSATVSIHEARLAVKDQVDEQHKATLDELKFDLKDIKPVIFEIREDQKRRQRIGK